jgi:microcystin-dependent protein
MAIPPFDPQTPIPNNPFYNAGADRYNLAYPTGQLIFGDNFLVDYSTGLIQLVPNGNRGTVLSITGTSGLITTPAGGITGSGSIDLEPYLSLTPGSYNNTLISVDPYGKVFAIVSQSAGITSVTGADPIFIAGSNPSISINIHRATSARTGSTQLLDSITVPDGTRALTANQGYLLGGQVGLIGSNLAGQKLGGLINVATGNVSVLTPDGAALPGISIGSPLPPSSATYNSLYFYTEGTGTYTPPGGTATSCVPNDKVLCLDGNWVVIQQGVRLVPATTTTAGISTLATGADVIALTDPSKFVTPASLAIMVSSTTQLGFTQLATDLEAQGLTASNRVLTPSSLDKIVSTTISRGIVRLSDSVFDPSVTVAPTANALRQFVTDSLSDNLITAKGDLIVGLGVGTPVVLPLGTNNSLLYVDNTKPTQGSLDWSVPDAVASWPVGAIIWNLTTVTPPSWVPCDGGLYNGAIGSPFYDLYQVIGTTFNTGGEGAGFFRVPDLRGKFIRGLNGGGSNPTPSALDPGRVFATTQSSAYAQHTHGYIEPNGGAGHFHALPPVTHAHPRTVTAHCHCIDGTNICHSHNMGGNSNFPVAAVGGDTDGYFGLSGTVGQKATTNTAFARISLAGAPSNIALSPVLSGLTGVQSCTLLCNQLEMSPPTWPPAGDPPGHPNETRPTNIALIPIIRYG